MSLVLISHDLGVVAENTDRVCVMYAGRIVEDAPIDAIFDRPAHPYTSGLLAALPELEGPRRPLVAIPGVVPEPWNLPRGCSFAPRCPRGRGCLRSRRAARRAGRARASRGLHPRPQPSCAGNRRLRQPLLEASALVRHYQVRRGGRLFGSAATLRAVDGVSFTLQPGRTLGLVGELGCGKTTTARLVLGLLP